MTILLLKKVKNNLANKLLSCYGGTLAGSDEGTGKGHSISL